MFQRVFELNIFERNIKGQDLDLKDEFFDHKYLTSYRALVGYGDIRYTLCTDKNGFRTYCENQFDEN